MPYQPKFTPVDYLNFFQSGQPMMVTIYAENPAPSMTYQISIPDEYDSPAYFSGESIEECIDHVIEAKGLKAHILRMRK